MTLNRILAVRLSLICTLLLGTISCQNDPIEDDGSARVIPECQSIDVSEYGDRFTIAYTIENPISTVPLSAHSEAKWITNIDNSVPGEVSFTVLCNDTAEPRETVLTLRYPSAKTHPEITIKQAATAEEKLSIEITSIDYSECSANIVPASDDISYILMLAEKDYFAATDIDDAEDLVHANEAYFRGYMTPDEGLAEFLKRSGFERKGNCKQSWIDLSPAKEYIIYAYGVTVIDDILYRTTPVYHQAIENRLPERSDIGFDLTANSNGPEISVEVDPLVWSGYYMVQFVEDGEAGYVAQGEEFTAANEEALAESFFYISDHIYYTQELSAEEVMQTLGHKGATTINKTLNANHDYMILVYAIDSESGNVPMMVSRPTIGYVTTGDVEKVEMTFEVEISNIRPRSVDISITPSADYPYNAVMMYAENLPEGSREEQLTHIMEKYPPIELVGPYREHIDQLPPSTEFVLAIYGYYAGAATTELQLYTFATLADGAGGNTITNVRCSAYDLREVAALEPYYSSFIGYADYFLSVEITTAEPSPSLHFDIFPSYLLEEYGLEEIRESLLEYSYTSSPDWALCTYGNEYVVCGLAEDTSGYIGEMYISEPISFKYEERGDAQEFVELYKDYVN